MYLCLSCFDFWELVLSLSLSLLFFLLFSSFVLNFLILDMCLFRKMLWVNGCVFQKMLVFTWVLQSSLAFKKWKGFFLFSYKDKIKMFWFPSGWQAYEHILCDSVYWRYVLLTVSYGRRCLPGFTCPSNRKIIQKHCFLFFCFSPKSYRLLLLLLYLFIIIYFIF